MNKEGATRRVKTTWELMFEGLACPHCGLIRMHKHYYPGPIDTALQHDENGNYWTWSPRDNEQEPI